ncbi:hypothetical protein LOK48_06545 (plasmid) [Wolbachia endosymbiont of Corcyra cephalonica]|uniref:hypothetical protein n=1 Tax=Wolbachia endosymbiont of Corcyra cephalonica TaxID=218111 RepID=UPI001E2B995E|nr:hypothetical protein [Wolbachia endosymbiont of Corcyra cephalonica]UFO01033.1 hypothetical protein LOK48_06545 [Wolbachia endosymbiont of Corcyra cephalonica]
MISREELARIIPVTPPRENKKINPEFHKLVTLECIIDPDMVVSQEKILIPVGMAIIIVAVVKYARESTSIPTVNI